MWPAQRLCLRASTDYWVNAMDGQPFFVVHQAVDPGLIQVIEQDIVPRLEREVPGQPDAERSCGAAPAASLHPGVRPRGLLAAVTAAHESAAHRLSELSQIPGRRLGAGGVLRAPGEALPAVRW